MSLEGKALIFSAPSGSGKTTVVRHLLNKFPELEFSISATTREPRKGEINGNDYEFLTENEFRQAIDLNKFLEYEEVYPGRFYGTLISSVENIWQSGKHVIFDVDVVGGVNLKKKLGNQALAVFIKVKSIGDLEKRLKKRDSDSSHEIKKRVNKAIEEIKYESFFDTTLINDKLDQTLRDAEIIVSEFLNNE
jgi:guanylate kinase